MFIEDEKNISSDKHLIKLLSNPGFHYFTVQHDNKLIGGLTVYEMIKYYGDNSELYIYDMVIDETYQNQGIGKKLLAFLKEWALETKFDSISVEAHSEDLQAIKMYAAVLGHPKKVDHFSFNVSVSQ